MQEEISTFEFILSKLICVHTLVRMQLFSFVIFFGIPLPFFQSSSDDILTSILSRLNYPSSALVAQLVYLCNLGMCIHAPQSSLRDLINLLGSINNVVIMANLSFMHSKQLSCSNYLTQVSGSPCLPISSVVRSLTSFTVISSNQSWDYFTKCLTNELDISTLFTWSFVSKQCCAILNLNFATCYQYIFPPSFCRQSFIIR